MTDTPRPAGKQLPTTRAQRLDADLELLTRAAGQYVDAEQRCALSRPNGLKGASYDGDRTTGTGASDGPTLALLADDGTLIDPTAKARAERDRALRFIHTGANLLANFVEAWAPRHPDTRAKRAAEDANAAELTCAHCTRWRAAGNAEAMFRHSDCAGRIAHPMALCKWCYDFVTRTASTGVARLPYKAEVERNDAGQRVNLPA